MALNLISSTGFPTYIALSTDIVNNKLPGAGIIGGTVYLEDTLTWKIISGNMLNLVDFKFPANYTALPSASSQEATTNEDTPKAITLVGAKAETLSLSYIVTTPPQHGVITGDLPAATYTPNEDFNGVDEFTFVVNDGLSNSIPATVSITIEPVNDAPVAEDQTIETSEDTPLDVILVANDIDEDELTYTIVAAPTHGDLTGTEPNLVYTPDVQYNGTDSFTFKVNDGTIDSNVATISITINAVNDIPVANAQSVEVNEDTPLPITLTANDIDADELTFIIVDEPLHGELTGLSPIFTYTPDAEYNGEDSFTFKANDGISDSLPETISITVNAINDTPVADEQTVETEEDTPLEITLTGSDIDNDPLTFEIVDEPLHGDLTGTIPDLTYTPDADYNGADSFTFKVNDGTIDSLPATIDITVTSVQDIPVADAQGVATDEDIPLAITLTGSDADNAPLTFDVVDEPLHGDLTGIAPDLIYTPDAEYNGNDSFTFTVNDGTDDSLPATIDITVNAVQDAPIADSQVLETDEDTPLTVTLTGSDVDNEQLTFTVVDVPLNGDLTGTAPDLTYTPDANYTGEDMFTFIVNDGTVNSIPAVISITVNPINDAPVANDQTVLVVPNGSAQFTLDYSDADNEALTYAVSVEPLHGDLTGIEPNLTYTPDTDYHGTDSFEYTVDDLTAPAASATVSIIVNTVPVATNQPNATAVQGVGEAITLTGSDADSDTLTYTVVDEPLHGILTGTIPSLTYTAAVEYTGTDTFTFKVNDGYADSELATVSILVSAP